jgi:hypothetical protein
MFWLILISICFQSYENCISGVMVIVMLDFYSARSQKQQSVDRHVVPLRHITLILSQPVFALSPYCCVLIAELALNSNHSLTQSYEQYSVLKPNGIFLIWGYVHWKMTLFNYLCDYGFIYQHEWQSHLYSEFADMLQWD